MLDFPDTPTVGQVFTSSGTAWHWDGVKWASYAGGGGYLPLTGGTVNGPLTVTGNTTLQGNTSTNALVSNAGGVVSKGPVSGGFTAYDRGNGGGDPTKWISLYRDANIGRLAMTAPGDCLQFSTSGSGTFLYPLTVTGNTGSVPLYVNNTSAAAWIQYTVQGVRSWASGPSTDGVFYFYDITAGSTRAYINTAGTFVSNFGMNSQAGIFTQGGPAWNGYGQALQMGGSTCIHWPDTGGGTWVILQTGNNGLLFGYSPSDSGGVQWPLQLTTSQLLVQGAVVATQGWVQGSYWTAATTQNQIQNYVNAIRLAYIADLGVTWPGSAVQEPYGGGIITGWSWNGSVTAAYRFRAVQYNIPNSGYIQASYA